MLWLLWTLLSAYPGRDGMVLVIVLLSVGIPHGANDLRLLRWRYRTLSMQQAFVLYGVVVVVAAGLMMGFPALGLGLFMGLTAYHFGQGDLHGYVCPPQLRTADWLYLSWGSLLLAALLGIHRSALVNYLPPTAGCQRLIQGLGHLPEGIWAYSGLAAGLLAAAVGGGYLKPGDAIRRLAVTLVLFALFAHTSLLFAFSVYFGIWHSADAIGLFGQRLYQGRSAGRVGQFYVHALPLTLLACGLLGAVLYAGPQLAQAYPLLFWLFAFLFGLTVPHVLVSAPIYRHTDP